jgi:transcriptional regulator with XRE-family HTH domain
MHSLANRMKILRKNKGLSQRALAECVCRTHPGLIGHSYIGMLETDKIRTPAAAIIQAVAEALDTSVDDLMGETTTETLNACVRRNRSARALCNNLSCGGTRHEPTEDVIGQSVLIPRFRALPACDRNGEPNRFCHLCGEAVVTECSKCQRPITHGSASYCRGCGHHLWRQPHEQPVVDAEQPVAEERDSAPNMWRIDSADDVPF